MTPVAQASGHEVWQATLDMVKGVSEVMLSRLPNFWKIAKGYMDGRFKKVGCIFTREKLQLRLSRCKSVGRDEVQRKHGLWQPMSFAFTSH